jgi:phage/plasmid-associated DNA primase
MLCNSLPKVKQSDDAFWNRIRVVPFESRFLPAEKCPKTYEEQVYQKIFPRDKDLSNKLGVMHQPLAWFLINRLQHLTLTNRVVPDKVLAATHQYKEENTVDPVDEFIDDMLDRIDDQSCFVLKTVVIQRYSEWFKAYNPGVKCDLKYARKELDKRFGASKWTGLRWKDEDTPRKANPLL